MRHIIAILLENESGALSRVAGLFSARNFNIESLTVAVTEDPSLSRMTIVTQGNTQIIEQLTKQLNKLLDVVKLIDLFDTDHIERELMLIKIKTSEDHATIKRLADIFRGRVISVAKCSYVVEITGNSAKLGAFIDNIDNANIIEIVRSGTTGIARNEKGLQL